MGSSAYVIVNLCTTAHYITIWLHVVHGTIILPILSALNAQGTLQLTVNSLLTRTWASTVSVHVHVCVCVCVCTCERERERGMKSVRIILYNTYFLRICCNSCISEVITRQKVVPSSTGSGSCYGNLNLIITTGILNIQIIAIFHVASLAHLEGIDVLIVKVNHGINGYLTVLHHLSHITQLNFTLSSFLQHNKQWISNIKSRARVSLLSQQLAWNMYLL